MNQGHMTDVLCLNYHFQASQQPWANQQVLTGLTVQQTGIRTTSFIVTSRKHCSVARNQHQLLICQRCWAKNFRLLAGSTVGIVATSFNSTWNAPADYKSWWFRLKSRTALLVMSLLTTPKHKPSLTRMSSDLMIAHTFTMPGIITELCTWTQPGKGCTSPSLGEDEPYREVRTTTLDLSPYGCLLKRYTVSLLRRCLSAVVHRTANSQSNSIGIQYKQGTWERDPCFDPI